MSEDWNALGALGLLVLGLAIGLSGCSIPGSPPTGTCTVRANGHDAAVTFDGVDALQGCNSAVNDSKGNFSIGSTASGADTICSTTVNGTLGSTTITVTDTGGHDIGNQMCANLAQYESNVGSS